MIKILIFFSDYGVKDLRFMFYYIWIIIVYLNEDIYGSQLLGNYIHLIELETL